MRFDLALKKSFGWLIAALIAIAAYFQAAGISHLLASAVAIDRSATPPSIPLARAFVAEAFDHSTAATAILARNPFDSTTGPLGGDAVPEGAVPTAAVRDIGPCETARVVLISASDDPSWSFASISSEGGHGVLRRVGDDVAGFTVESIERDRVRLTSKQISCEAVLGAAPIAAKPPPPPPPGAGAPAKPGGVPPEIAAGIRKTGERSFTVQRAALDAILARQAELFGRLRIAPDKEGLRLAGVKPDSLLGTLGIQNGDHLQRINGFDIADPHSALEAYSKLMSASSLVISATRNGQPLNYDLKIE